MLKARPFKSLRTVLKGPARSGNIFRYIISVFRNEETLQMYKLFRVEAFVLMHTAGLPQSLCLIIMPTGPFVLRLS